MCERRAHGCDHVCFLMDTPYQCSRVMVAFTDSISRQERCPSRAIRSNAKSAAEFECGWPWAMMYLHPVVMVTEPFNLLTF